MDPVAAAGNSIEAVNAILQTANQASLEAAEKLMKVAVEMTVGAESGKGAEVDLSA